MPAASGDILGRFWSKVDQRGDDECWPWRSNVDTYGRFRMLRDAKCIGAHVFSWVLANQQEVPAGLLVLHSCDNKRCVNPAHLSVGTYSQNAREAVERGQVDISKAHAGIKRKTHCKRNHELSPENTYVVGQHRRCARCHNMRQRIYREMEKR